MYVCELIPLKTSKKIEFLTYYSTIKISSGDLVLINMHGQKLNAVVFEVNQLRESKLDIKNKNFKIKKIGSIITHNYINKNLLPSLYNISTYLGTSINNILSTLISLENLHNIRFEKRNKNSSKINFMFMYEFRLETLNESNYLIAPTRLLVNKFNKDYQKIARDKKIICSTPSFDFLINPNINHVYIMNECSNYYYRMWKGLDAKLALTLVCDLLHIDITFVDSYPSLSTYSKLGESDKSNIINQVKNTNTKKINIIKMNDENNKADNPYIHQDLKIKLREALKENMKIIIYNLSKGYASHSICNDCNNYVSCDMCHSPYKLTQIIKKEGDVESVTRYHECSKCNLKIELDKIILCNICSSYNINTLGIGTESVQSYLSDNLKLDAQIIDSEHIKNKLEIKKVLDNWRKSGGIIIGTDLILNNLDDDEVDLIIITSLDSLFYIKNYMIDEILFNMLLILLNL